MRLRLCIISFWSLLNAAEYLLLPQNPTCPSSGLKSSTFAIMQYLDSVRWILATFLALFRPYSITNPSTSVSFAATEFDVIIVGGGTAGLVVANRLSAPRSLDTTPLRVGVIDAGWSASEGDPLIDIPYGANIFLGNSSASTVGNPKYDWMYQTVPQPALDGRIIGYPRYAPLIVSFIDVPYISLCYPIVVKYSVGPLHCMPWPGNAVPGQTMMRGELRLGTGTTGLSTLYYHFSNGPKTGRL